MNCRKVTHLLSAYIDGELQGVEHRQIHEHLAGCSECMQEHRGLVQTKRMLASLRMREPSADLPQRILSQVGAQQTFRAPWLEQFNRWVQVQGLKPQSLALAATFALGGIVFASYTIDRADPGTPVVFPQQMTPRQVAVSPTLPGGATYTHPGSAPNFSYPAGNSSMLPAGYQTLDEYPVSQQNNMPQHVFFKSLNSHRAH